MKTLSPLSVDPAFALVFRTLPPPPEKPASLLVLLHGVGGNENNLAALGAEAGSGTKGTWPIKCSTPTWPANVVDEIN